MQTCSLHRFFTVLYISISSLLTSYYDVPVKKNEEKEKKKNKNVALEVTVISGDL